MSDSVRSEALPAGHSAAPRLDEYPERLSAKDMAAIFRVSQKRLYAIDAEGALLWAENRPRIGRRSWSRERVRRYFAD